MDDNTDSNSNQIDTLINERRRKRCQVPLDEKLILQFSSTFHLLNLRNKNDGDINKNMSNVQDRDEQNRSVENLKTGSDKTEMESGRMIRAEKRPAEEQDDTTPQKRVRFET